MLGLGVVRRWLGIMVWDPRGRSVWGVLTYLIVLSGNSGGEISLVFGRMSELGGKNLESNSQELPFKNKEKCGDRGCIQMGRWEEWLKLAFD